MNISSELNELKLMLREFKGNFKVAGERFTVEQIKGWMYEIVGAGLADWIAEGVIKLNQI
ncbi:MAG: hypothetical protein ACYTXT_37430 [Nostoc sp.]